MKTSKAPFQEDRDKRPPPAPASHAARAGTHVCLRGASGEGRGPREEPGCGEHRPPHPASPQPPGPSCGKTGGCLTRARLGSEPAAPQNQQSPSWAGQQRVKVAGRGGARPACREQSRRVSEGVVCFCPRPPSRSPVQ